MLLRDPSAAPDKEALRHALRDSFTAYEAMVSLITAGEYNLDMLWRYYNDGKAWLCKVTGKKKTVFWLSAWDGFFRTGFYLSERHCEGINQLDIDEKIKTGLRNSKPSGKLFPLVLDIYETAQLSDLMKLIDYKLKLK